jgi:hypothetical protein
MPFDPEAYPSDPSEVETPTTTFQYLPSTYKKHASRVDAMMHEIQAQDQQLLEQTRAQRALMNEARVRFAKASLYEQILQGRLFTENDAVTQEVEAEFREFAQAQLCSLLGIDHDGNGKSPKLDDEQIEVLIELANRVLQREAPSAPSSPPLPPKPVAMMPPRPPPAPAPAAPKVRRTVRTPVRSPVPVPRATGDYRPPEQLQLPLQTPSLRAVQLPSGMTATVSTQPSQTLPAGDAGSPAPKPMPSPDEMVAIAAYQGEQGFRNHKAKIITETAPQPAGV